jgi:serine/threonine protein phosphatase 1
LNLPLAARTLNPTEGLQQVDPEILDAMRPGWRGRFSGLPSTGDDLVYAIGDIHGRLDLLDTMLDMIRTDASASAYAKQPRLVFLGDYVDRGPSSRQVMEKLISLESASWSRVRCLAGNHEAEMLRFLEAEGDGFDWLMFGGRETLVSYGVESGGLSSTEDVAALRQEARKRVPLRHLDFLRRLGRSETIGDYFFVHAGVRPGVALTDQADDDLLRIRGPFLDSGAPLEKVIVHGHTPMQGPYHSAVRIGVDTGAYATGVLTAVRLDAETQRFIQAKARR